MLQKKTKAFSLVMCVVMALVAAMSMGLTGCKNSKKGEQVDKTKTQLYIGAYGGGYGTAYIDDLEKRFEDYTKDWVFPDGTKGVQIIYEADQLKYTAEQMTTNISRNKYDLFYLSGSELSTFVKNGSVAEITDVVKADLSEYGDPAGSTIEKKLSKEQKDYLLRDEKYYELPFADTSMGMIYNVEIFEKYGLYIAKDGSPTERLVLGEASNHDGDLYNYSWVGADGEKSAGPDGKYETEYDNGLPATLADYNMLLQKMHLDGVKSLIWTDEASYAAFAPKAFYVNYHGPVEAAIMNTGGGDGVLTDIITGFDSEGNPTIVQEEISISKGNISTLSKQAGHYFGLKMFQMASETRTVSSDAYRGWDATRIQEAFVKSNIVRGADPVAFMIEGSWWESEADTAGIFKRTKDKKERKFGFFPMPCATDEQYKKRISGEERGTIIGDSTSIVIRNGLSDMKLELAKEFLKFSLTNESLRRFTITTSIPAPYEYELESEDYNNMTYFAKNFIELYQNSNVLNGYVSDAVVANPKVYNARNDFNYYAAKGPNGEYEFFTAEFNKTNGVTPREYFEGLFRFNDNAINGK